MASFSLLAMVWMLVVVPCASADERGAASMTRAKRSSRAVARRATADPVTSAAETLRLVEELHRLAARQAWTGVERVWAELAAADGVGCEELLAAADAATQLGDLGAARERLLAALALQERRDVVERLWSIDTAYGSVRIVSAGPSELVIPAADFFPVAQRAVDVARRQLAESGQYEGWLPIGRYQIDGEEVYVRPGPRTTEHVPAASSP